MLLLLMLLVILLEILSDCDVISPLNSFSEIKGECAPNSEDVMCARSLGGGGVRGGGNCHEQSRGGWTQLKVPANH